MHALYKREVRSYFLSPFAYVLSAVFLLVFSLSFIKSVSNMSSSTLRFNFPDIYYANFYYFVFMIPLLTMRTFAEERKSHTETMWLSAPVTIPQVVLAKFFAVVTVYLLMLALSLIFPLIAFIKGNVIISSLICGYIGFALWGMVCIAVGVFCSAMTDNPILAAILGEGAMIILIFLDDFTSSGLIQSMPFVAKIFLWFSTEHRFEGFSRGFFSLADLMFFVSLTAVVLVWTVILVEKRRWSRG